MIKFQASDVKDSLDDTWIVSVQSPVQRELLDAHPHDISVFVEGAFRIWLRNASVSYFILRADPRPKPNLPPEDFDGMHNICHLEQILSFQEPPVYSHTAVSCLHTHVFISPCVTSVLIINFLTTQYEQHILGKK